MNFNNELYVFNEVPGYDASKGERIVKALHKFWIKIANLEQVRILEKKALSKEVQTTDDADLTLADIQVELLQTQLYYLIKIAREYSNDDSKAPSDCKNKPKEAIKSFQVTQSNSPITDIPDNKNHLKSHEDAGSTVIDLQDNVFPVNSRDPTIKVKSCETISSYIRPCASASTSTSVPPMHPKVNSQPHYHMKLDDVPFILGASTSASHSVVANVQNIIGMMKMHNKALCASKPQLRQNATSVPNKSCPQDANEMLQELSDDLSKLTKKQEKLKQMFDNTQAVQLSDKAKKEVKNCDKKEKTKNFESISSSGVGQDAVSSKRSEELKNREKDSTKTKEHLIPADKTKTNPHLARRKMLRSLQDFKMHLSAEDISWN